MVRYLLDESQFDASWTVSGQQVLVIAGLPPSKTVRVGKDRDRFSPFNK